MALEFSQLSNSSPILRVGDLVSPGGQTGTSGWQEIVSKVSSYVSAPKSTPSSAGDVLKQMTGLMRLQMDITQYQLRVEVVSKIAESGVASLRKLQQSQ